VINSAEMSLYYFQAPYADGTNLHLRKVTSLWDESTLNWFNQPISDNTNLADLTINYGQYGWKTFPITQLVSDWIDGLAPNYGVLDRKSVV